MKKTVSVSIVLICFLLSLVSCDSVAPPSVVEPENFPPVADTGPNQMIMTTSEVFLDGSTSNDPNGDSLSFVWSFTDLPQQSVAFFDDSTSITPRFIADIAGIYEISLTVSDGEFSSTDGITIMVEFQEFDDNILTAQTLPANTRYFINTILRVNATLTIEPGVTMLFGAGAGLQVDPGGSLQALGTEADSIRFIGEQSVPGYWLGISIGSNNPTNELAYVRISHGGSGFLPGVSSQANLALAVNARLRLRNSTLTESEEFGLHAEADALLSDFSANTFRNNTSAPVHLPPTLINALDEASTFTGNGRDQVDIFVPDARSGILIEDQTWPALGENISYRINGLPTIQSALTIEAGATFIMAANAGLIVGLDGSLQAVGTEADSIRFIGEQSVPGYWLGIDISSNNPTNELSYVRISHGGSNLFPGIGSRANLALDLNARLQLSNTTLTESEEFGLHAEADARLPTFSANTFRNNTSAPVHLPPTLINVLDEASTFTGNGRDQIDIFVPDQLSGILVEDQNWPALGEDISYRLSGVPIFEAILTIEAGATFIMAANSGFIIGIDGSLRALGTEADSIRFIGEQSVPGYWLGLAIGSNNPTNEMQYVVVSEGGNARFTTPFDILEPANVALDDGTQLKITHSALRNSDGWGLWLDGNAIVDPVNPQEETAGNVFSNNNTGNVGSFN